MSRSIKFRSSSGCWEVIGGYFFSVTPCNVTLEARYYSPRDLVTLPRPINTSLVICSRRRTSKEGELPAGGRAGRMTDRLATHQLRWCGNGRRHQMLNPAHVTRALRSVSIRLAGFRMVPYGTHGTTHDLLSLICPPWTTKAKNPSVV